MANGISRGHDPVREDLQRLGIRLPKAPRLPMLPDPPPLPGLPRAQRDPDTPLETLGSVPKRVQETANEVIAAVNAAPQKLAIDASRAVDNLTEIPRVALQEAFRAPGELIDRFSPANISALLNGLTHNLDFQTGDPKEWQQRARTITDFIPFI